MCLRAGWRVALSCTWGDNRIASLRSSPVLPHCDRIAPLATADAGAAMTRNIRSDNAGRRGQQVLSRRPSRMTVRRTTHLQRGCRCAFLHDVEVVIEARDLDTSSALGAFPAPARPGARPTDDRKSVPGLVHCAISKSRWRDSLPNQALHFFHRTRGDAPALCPGAALLWRPRPPSTGDG